MGNITTEAMLKTFNMLKSANNRLGEIGKIPYGQKKATPAERKIQKAAAEEAELQELLNG